MEDIIEIRPTAKQEAFLACDADIAIYGGGAGSGKTWSALADQARWAGSVPGFRSVIFRRTYPEIMNPGALWDESMELLPHFGGRPTKSDSRWDFPHGSWIKFSHLQLESSIFAWQGAQLAAAAFEELPHFTAKMFFYLISRLRSKCGVTPYIRATCNPEPGSWVYEFLSWWIDPLTGFPIQSRAGVHRYFIRQGNKIVWADTAEELPQVLNGKPTRPRSVTFFPALVDDNPHVDPDYAGNLASLPYYERMLLLEGNWAVRPEGGMRFKAKWFGTPQTPPPLSEFVRLIRYWDRASTEPSASNPDPDWTAGVLYGEHKDGHYWVLDAVRDRLRPAGVRKLIDRTAVHDGPNVELWMDEDPASAGQAEKDELARVFAKYGVRFRKPQGSKWVRSAGLSSACENGLVHMAAGDWNEDFLNEYDAFVDEKTVKTPSGYHDDWVDGGSQAHSLLVSGDEVFVLSTAPSSDNPRNHGGFKGAILGR